MSVYGRLLIDLYRIFRCLYIGRGLIDRFCINRDSAIGRCINDRWRGSRIGRLRKKHACNRTGDKRARQPRTTVAATSVPAGSAASVPTRAAASLSTGPAARATPSRAASIRNARRKRQTGSNCCRACPFKKGGFARNFLHHGLTSIGARSCRPCSCLQAYPNSIQCLNW